MTKPTNAEIKQLEALQRSLETIEALYKEIEDIKAAGGDATRTARDAALEGLDILTKQHVLEIQIVKLKEKAGLLSAEQAKENLISLKTAIQQTAVDEKRTKEIINFGKGAATSLSSMTGIGAQSNNILGKMIQLKGRGIGFSESIGEAAAQFGKALTISNMLASVVDKIVEQTVAMAKEQQTAYADFEKEAGNVEKYKDQIMDLRNANGMYGISVTNSAKTFAQFKNEFAGFDGMSKTQQNALTETSSRLSKLGLAESDVIKTQQLLIKGMGMTVTESTNLQKSLFATAHSMGLPPKQVAADFAKASPQLAAHGKNMTKVFLDLQNNAKNTGIAFDRLLAITSKFDTFEGAADSAGQLNAILGGDYLNSIELLNAEEGDRVKIMQEALKASARTVDSMSKQEQLATAQALGLENVTELQKLMNNETTMGAVEQASAAKAQKDMNKAIENATQLSEAFKNMMAKLALNLEPVINGLKTIIMSITGFMDRNDGIVTSLGVLMLAFGGLVLALKAVVSVFKLFQGLSAAASLIKGAVTPVAASTGALGSSLTRASVGVRAIGSAMTQSAIGMLAFGGAVLLIGAGIAIAAYGLSLLVGSFAGLGPAAWPAAAAVAAVSAAFVGLVFALVPLIPLLIVGGGPLLAFGAAMLLIGAGIAIAAYGLSLLVGSFAGLGPAATPAAFAVAAMSLALAVLATALIFLIPTLAVGVKPLLAFGAAMLLVGAGVGLAAAGVGYITKGIGEMFNTLSNVNSKNITVVFDALFDAMSLTGIGKVAAFAIAISGLADDMSELNKNTVAVVGNLDKIKGTANVSVNTARVSTTTAAAMNTNTGSTSTAGSSNIIPVAIYIDSKKIGEILDPRYKQMIQDSLKNIGSKTVPI